MQKKHSSRLWWSVEYVAIVLMCTVLLGLMGCKESDPLSSEKEITEFSITLNKDETTSHPGEIDPVSRTIVVPLPPNTPVVWLVPAVTISDLAKVSPASGMEYDFSAPVKYVVTAEDGSTQDYLVTVKVERTTGKDITKFELRQSDGTVVVGVTTNQNIVVTVDQGTDLTRLVPVFTVSPNASVTDDAGDAVTSEAQVADFTNPVYYTVTAQDGSTKEYTVIVKIKGEAVGLSIDLVQDTIVNLFGLTLTEAAKATTDKGIQLSITGSRREAVVSLTGFSNTRTNDSNVNWVVDSGRFSLTTAGNVFTIKASEYTIGRHWVEVTGTKAGVQYSKTFYFTVDK
jgi:hypothetical protein